VKLSFGAVNPSVFSVRQDDGLHVGNLKRIGDIWKFKAVGYDANGLVEPGGGPLTHLHNTPFAAPDADEVNKVLGCHL
jgi:hypothetical protein